METEPTTLKKISAMGCLQLAVSADLVLAMSLISGASLQ